jgi:hypothetical protein
MATFIQRGNRWRAQVQRNHVRAGATFATLDEAKMWAKSAERSMPPCPVGARRKRLSRELLPTGYRLLSRSELIALAIPYKRICGVYFLFRDEEIVYVGQSADVHRRLMAHRNRIKFDAVAIVPCDEDTLCIAEAYYIAGLRPAHNLVINMLPPQYAPDLSA